MTSVAPGALRRILRHVEEMTNGKYAHDPATELRLGVMRRRADARVAAAAGDLAAAAQARGAPAELRALAASVRAGKLTWEQCVAGKADNLPEVRAWYAPSPPAGTGPRHSTDLDDDDDMDQFPFRRDY